MSSPATRIGIIGDGFMAPHRFTRALREAMPDRALEIAEMELDWPLRLVSTKVDPVLPIKEFLGRPEDYFDFIRDLDILITHLAPVTRESLDHAPGLRLIGVSRGGVVNVDVAAARERGVPVIQTPGRNASAVAEFTIASLLAETRNIVRGHIGVANGTFRRDFYHADHVGPELCELTVGVVGYGDIGRRVVRLLRAFGARVIVADPYQTLGAEALGDGVEQRDLDAMLPEIDVLTLHPRVTPETMGMISRERIAAMKPGGYIVNTTRGQVLDYDALYDALVSGQLRGAALDTFSPEPPPPDSPLLQLPNVTLSPHIAGASTFSIDKAAGMIAGDVARFLAGETPVYISGH